MVGCVVHARVDLHAPHVCKLASATSPSNHTPSTAHIYLSLAWQHWAQPASTARSTFCSVTTLDTYSELFLQRSCNLILTHLLLTTQPCPPKYFNPILAVRLSLLSYLLDSVHLLCRSGRDNAHVHCVQAFGAPPLTGPGWCDSSLI